MNYSYSPCYVGSSDRTFGTLGKSSRKDCFITISRSRLGVSITSTDARADAPRVRIVRGFFAS